VFVGVLLTLPAVLAAWRVAVDRAPRWAWAGAALAMLGVLGEMAHLTGYFAIQGIVSGELDPAIGATVMMATERDPLFLVLFAPFFLALLCVIPQAIALLRAKVIPIWAGVALLGGTAVMAVFGSSLWSSAAWTALMVAGFAPAAVVMLRGRPHARVPVAQAAGVPS
jgi:hypothetical protein